MKVLVAASRRVLASAAPRTTQLSNVMQSLSIGSPVAPTQVTAIRHFAKKRGDTFGGPSGGPSGGNSDDEDEVPEEPQGFDTSKNLFLQAQERRQMVEAQQDQGEQFDASEDVDDEVDITPYWDEAKMGKLSEESWMGFEGDLDEMTPEGVPKWVNAIRLKSHVLDERRRLEREARRALAEAKMNPPRYRQVDEKGRAYGTGRRKTSTARVWIKPASEPFGGRIKINKKDLTEYFVRETHKEDVLKPFVVVDKVGAFDVYCTVKGGGLTGQAGAVRHGLSRALQHFDPELRSALKKQKLLRRDPRMVERKKPGQPKARKKFQWVKR